MNMNETREGKTTMQHEISYILRLSIVVSQAREPQCRDSALTAEWVATTHSFLFEGP